MDDDDLIKDGDTYSVTSVYCGQKVCDACLALRHNNGVSRFEYDCYGNDLPNSTYDIEFCEVLLSKSERTDAIKAELLALRLCGRYYREECDKDVDWYIEQSKRTKK